MNQLVLTPLLLLMWSGAAPLSAMDPEQAVDAGRDGLGGVANFPWYDEPSDQLRRIEVKPSRPPPQPGDWEWQPQRQNRPNWNWSSALWDALQVLVWAMLIVLLIAVVWLLVRAFLRREAGEADTGARGAVELGEGDIDRIENLPFPLKRPQTDLLGEARRHYEAGDFSEAIIYLFSYQLLQLDKSHLLRLARGKTNRQYLGEIRPYRDVRTLLAETMYAFEDVFFGNRALDRVRFESCWTRLDEFHHLLEQVPMGS